MTDYKKVHFECFLTMKIPSQVYNILRQKKGEASICVELHLFIGNSEEIFSLGEKLLGEILFLEILLLNKNPEYHYFFLYKFLEISDSLWTRI